MGNVKFSALPSAPTLGQADFFCVVQGGASKQSPVSNLWEPTAVGNANYTILATDVLVYTSVAFTASRTWTLPSAASYGAGRILRVVDLLRTVTATNTLVLQRGGTDTINGATSATIAAAGGSLLVVSDGVSRWTTVGAGGAAPSGNSFQAFTSSAAANTNSTQSAGEHHAKWTLNAGGAAYTATLSLLRAGRLAGDSVTVHFDFAASTNPTAQVFDDTTAGARLWQWTGDGTATAAWATFVFDGAAWYLEGSSFIL